MLDFWRWVSKEVINRKSLTIANNYIIYWFKLAERFINEDYYSRHQIFQALIVGVGVQNIKY